ncbi:MAG TPA: maleylpyruvate isomerase family mycothiol-dependent enzyme [Candidatus Ruania gallistercoris]|uniref:Maleylpyruvate isomerase family mycothiol-dependent enzyme n=1 Tax=Candidatus Ruania gallistercoris TaxID=2838746 RepID=A0A9D2EI81_9MICO|nr:maleylpyruvate isomerase family mycothiol-dependent enzyme [Candidatus Ruania gallistercoris]
MTETSTEVTEQTYAERARLAGLLAGLTPEQWAHPTLCADWRVRDVVAHMTAPFHTSGLRMLAGLARARFNYDRYAAPAARRDADRMGDAELLRILQENLRTPWPASGGGPEAGLSHDVIHGLDLTVPLGLPAAPTERIALVLVRTTPRSLAYFDVDLGGRRLVATDADVAIGSGADLPLPAREILLVITGRRSLSDVMAQER